MNQGHLPAGPGAPRGGGSGVDPYILNGVNHGYGPGPTQGPRRGGARPPQHYNNHPVQHYQSQNHQQHMYGNYMNAYSNPYYPPPMHIPAQYPNSHMPPHGYMHYAQPSYGPRSPAAIPPPYAPMVNSNHMSQNYNRPHPPPPMAHSPAMSAPYQPPHMPLHSLNTASMIPPIVSGSQPSTAPPPPQTPSSNISTVPRPPTAAVSVAQSVVAEKQPPPPPPVDSSPSVADQPSGPPFEAPLPWSSHPEYEFPKRAKQTRTRRRRMVTGADVVLPSNRAFQTEELATASTTTVARTSPQNHDADKSQEVDTAATPRTSHTTPAAPATAKASQNDAGSPSRSARAPSVATSSTLPTTPGSTISETAGNTTTPTRTAQTKPAGRIAPAIPILSATRKTSPKETRSTEPTPATTVSEGAHSAVAKPTDLVATTVEIEQVNGNVEHQVKAPAVQAPAPPKSWSALVARRVAAGSSSGGAVVGAVNGANGASSAAATTGATSNGTVGFTNSKSNALAEALRSYRVGAGGKFAFIEPRGFVNGGNMCYMNSVLQVLLFCTPFYSFLEQASRSAAHSFKSQTPLVDSMMTMIHEFKIIDSAESIELLRRRLKNEELEQKGEQFTPEGVYEAIRKLPRFDSMRHGHQQDAQEFLGFLLESLHDECAQLMGVSSPDTNQNSAMPTLTSSQSSAAANNSNGAASDWFEVGYKSRATVTRSSGQSATATPITKIFGGQLRSELRVPGLKDSVTLEPYQPLQLDIGASHIRNIVDAMKNLTRPETLHGDFNSSRGKDVTATKQVFIESLPPVLILHLKRFQFDAEGHGTVKVWKKVGYPLDLEIPVEVFSRQKRNTLLADRKGLPKYKLTAAVYHHGKSASGGHYTVDIRRQDDRDWIRFDDTVIRRVSSEEVAEGGAEEAVPTGGLRKDTSTHSNGGNRFASMGDGESSNGDTDEGWKQVNNTQAGGNRKWSSVANGNSSGTSTPKNGAGGSSGSSSNNTTSKQHQPGKSINLKENKVAYLLFYSRV